MSGINYYGVLADGFKVTPAISAAAEQTRRFAEKIIKARTPVDTGTLKRSWDIDLEGQGLRITNDAPYAPFVELGTKKMAGFHMVERSMPEIQREFRRQLGVSLGKALASAITMGVEPPELSYNNIADATRKSKGGFRRGAKQRRATYNPRTKKR